MGRACSVQTWETWEGHGETWMKHGKDMGRTWEGHGKIVFMSGLWGDVRTWEGHGETRKERVCVWGDMERYRVTSRTEEEHGETWEERVLCRHGRRGKDMGKHG